MSEWRPIESVPEGRPVLVHWAEPMGFDGSTEVAVLKTWMAEECVWRVE